MYALDSATPLCSVSKFHIKIFFLQEDKANGEGQCQAWLKEHGAVLNSLPGILPVLSMSNPMYPLAQQVNCTGLVLCMPRRRSKSCSGINVPQMIFCWEWNQNKV